MKTARTIGRNLLKQLRFRSLTSRDVATRLTWAKRNDTPLTVLMQLCDDDDIQVVQAAASSELHTAESLEALARHHNATVRLEVTRHSHTPIEVLTYLSADKDNQVSKEAQNGLTAALLLNTAQPTEPYWNERDAFELLLPPAITPETQLEAVSATAGQEANEKHVSQTLPTQTERYSQLGVVTLIGVAETTTQSLENQSSDSFIDPVAESVTVAQQITAPLELGLEDTAKALDAFIDKQDRIDQISLFEGFARSHSLTLDDALELHLTRALKELSAAKRISRVIAKPDLENPRRSDILIERRQGSSHQPTLASLKATAYPPKLPPQVANQVQVPSQERIYPPEPVKCEGHAQNRKHQSNKLIEPITHAPRPRLGRILVVPKAAPTVIQVVEPIIIGSFAIPEISKESPVQPVQVAVMPTIATSPPIQIVKPTEIGAFGTPESGDKLPALTERESFYQTLTDESAAPISGFAKLQDETADEFFYLSLDTTLSVVESKNIELQSLPSVYSSLQTKPDDANESDAFGLYIPFVPNRQQASLDAVDRRTVRQRAEQLAAELVSNHRLDLADLDPLADVLEVSGSGRVKQAVGRLLSSGASTEEITLCFELKCLWLECPDYNTSWGYRQGTGWTTYQRYDNLSWPLALRFIRGFNGLPDIDEVEHALAGHFERWSRIREYGAHYSFVAYLMELTEGFEQAFDWDYFKSDLEPLAR